MRSARGRTLRGERAERGAAAPAQETWAKLVVSPGRRPRGPSGTRPVPGPRRRAEGWPALRAQRAPGARVGRRARRGLERAEPAWLQGQRDAPPRRAGRISFEARRSIPSLLNPQPTSCPDPQPERKTHEPGAGVRKAPPPKPQPTRGFPISASRLLQARKTGRCRGICIYIHCGALRSLGAPGPPSSSSSRPPPPPPPPPSATVK